MKAFFIQLSFPGPKYCFCVDFYDNYITILAGSNSDDAHLEGMQHRERDEDQAELHMRGRILRLEKKSKQVLGYCFPYFPD